MPTNQGLRQASVRAATGTTYDYNGDWMALFDLDGVSSGDYNGRLLAWINQRLVADYTDLPAAQMAFAIANGATDWNGLGTITIGTNFIVLLETSGAVELEDATGFVALE